MGAATGNGNGTYLGKILLCCILGLFSPSRDSGLVTNVEESPGLHIKERTRTGCGSMGRETRSLGGGGEAMEAR